MAAAGLVLFMVGLLYGATVKSDLWVRRCVWFMTLGSLLMFASLVVWLWRVAP